MPSHHPASTTARLAARPRPAAPPAAPRHAANTLPPVPASEQRGFSLLWTAVIVLFIAGVSAAGYTVLHSRAQTRAAADQAQALRWADDTLASYASTYGRLPCPALVANGAEDCSLSKGWLPVQTLEKTLGDPSPFPSGPSGSPSVFDSSRPAGTVGAIKYLLYRQADAKYDLGAISHTYDPRRPEFDPTQPLDDQLGPPGGDALAYDLDDRRDNGLDFCLKLQTIAPFEPLSANGDRWRISEPLKLAGNPAYAHVQSPAGQIVNVAYGLAVPGSDGVTGSGLFSGENAKQGHVLEWPHPTPGKQDQVSVRSFQDLGRNLQCSAVLASLDGLAAAVGMIDDTLALREGTREDTRDALIRASVSVALQSAMIVASTIIVIQAVETLAWEISQIILNTITCAASLGLSPTCALIGVQAAAMAVTIETFVAAAGALGANTLPLPMLVATVTRYGILYRKLGGSAPMPSQSDLEATKKVVCDSVKEFDATLDDRKKDVEKARKELQQTKDKLTAIEEQFAGIIRYVDLASGQKRVLNMGAPQQSRVKRVVEAYANAQYAYQQRQKTYDRLKGELDTHGTFEDYQASLKKHNPQPEPNWEVLRATWEEGKKTLVEEVQTAKQAQDLAKQQLDAKFTDYDAVKSAAWQDLVAQSDKSTGKLPTSNWNSAYCPLLSDKTLGGDLDHSPVVISCQNEKLKYFWQPGVHTINIPGTSPSQTTPFLGGLDSYVGARTAYLNAKVAFDDAEKAYAATEEGRASAQKACDEMDTNPATGGGSPVGISTIGADILQRATELGTSTPIELEDRAQP